MPGLIGYLKRKEAENDRLTLAAMARRLHPEDRFKLESFEDGPVGLGRVSLGILNPSPQPVWSNDHNIGLILEGEFYDHRATNQSPGLQPEARTFGNDAAYALRLYEIYEDEFADYLNGAFTLAIWDRRRQKLILANDRLGLYPLYYAHTSAGLIFASGVRALLADSTLPCTIDRIAFAQFLTFDHVLDDRTYLESVKLLPQASLLIYQAGNLQIQPYWKLEYAPIHRLHNEQEDVQELNHLMNRAVARQAQDDLKKGVLLSGGLDSRVVLAELTEILPPKSFHTFTWGIRGCDDCRAADELAAIVGSIHHTYELRPDWLIHKAEEAVRLTDGLGNIVNLHALALAEEEAKFAQVFYKGFLGDAMFGFAVNRRFWANYDDQTAYRAHVRSHHDHGVIIFDEPDHPSLFTDDFRKSIGQEVFESYRRGMRRANSTQLAIQRLYFDLTQRVPRMTINGVEVVRSYAAVRLPFADYDLVDFSLDLPPGYMYERYLTYRAFTEAYPNLAKVPNPSTGLPMISCARYIWLRALREVRWHLEHRGFSKLLAPERRPYKDYSGWFRTNLRGWMENILLDPLTLDRGLFQPEMIRQQIAEHMAGTDRAVRLGGLLTLELWQRQFID